MHTKRLAYVAAGGLFALTLACGTPSTSQTVTKAGSTNANTAQPTAQPAQVAAVGDTIKNDKVALTVAKVDTTATIGQFQKAKDGNTFVIADVIVEAVADKQPYNPLYFKVKDADGREYNATISTADDSLKTGELTAGDKARGTVAFEVPSAASGLVLSYQPVVIGADAPLRVKLN